MTTSTIDATCTKDGSKTTTCTNANCDFEEVEVLPKTGHSYGEFVETKAPTCEEEGIKTKTCSKCQDTVTETISATGHDFTDYISNGDATCMQDGTKTAHCNNGCEATDCIEDKGSKKEHSYTDYQQDENGYMTAVCDFDCGATHTIYKLVTKDDSYVELKKNEETNSTICKKVKIGSTAEELIQMFKDSENVKIFDQSGIEVDAGAILCSGYVIKLIIDGNIVDEAMVIITGDLDGNGVLNSKDVTMLRRLYAGGWENDVYTAAFDTDGNGIFEGRDVCRLKRYISEGWDVTIDG